MKSKGDKEYWQLIWDKFIKGDREAFETIYNEFVDTLFAYGSKFTPDKSLLEDAIQDVFLNIFNYGKKLRQPEYLEFYLFKTLRNILFRKFKENNFYSRNEDLNVIFDLKFPIEELDENENKQEEKFLFLRREIKKLDNKKRELLFLKFNSGLTYSEIGELLDVKPDTAKKQVHRLLGYFRKKMGNTLMTLFLTSHKV